MRSRFVSGKTITLILQRSFRLHLSFGGQVGVVGLFALLFTMPSLVATAQPDTWTQKADYGGGARLNAVGFSIGGKGYIGTGYDSNTTHSQKDFWEYDPATSTWTQKANVGGGARQNAVGFAIGNKGYIGTGSGFDDFWEYDPATNAWTQKANFGGGATSYAVGFSIGSKGYIGTGSSGYGKDFWEYDPSTNAWTQKADFGGIARYGAVGFSIGSKGYIGTGGQDGIPQNDFWEYDPTTNAWTQKANFGGTARSYAVGFSIGSKGYIGTGYDGNYKNDFWEYDPATNAWTQKASLGGGIRDFAVGFSIGSNGFISTGGYFDGSNHYYNDLWEYTPVCLGFTFYADADGDDYGSAGNTYNASDCMAPSGYVIDSFDCDDTNPGVNPAALEICDGIDNNCDGAIDPLFTFYADADGDGFGDNNISVVDCILPSGFVSDSTDCDDTNVSINSSAIEICNNLDDNCNGTIDDGFIFITYYADGDGDSYGDQLDSGNSSCNNPGAGYVTNNLDCDDANETVHPYAAELLNGIDDNCNGIIDIDQDIWVLKTAFGGDVRNGAVGFSIGSRGYVGTGLGNNEKKDFWEYDPATDAWTQKANFAGPTKYAVGFSIGSKGYIGTGGDGSSLKNDFWEYDPTTNAWTQKANFGGSSRKYAVGFSIGDLGYIGTGNDGGYKNDFWEYNPITDTWTQKANFPGAARSYAAGFSIGSKGYIGTGNDGTDKKDFWEYNPFTNDWTQKADFGGTPRSGAAGFSIGSKGYIGTGSFTKDFWEYDPAADMWAQKADFGGTARNSAVGFSIGTKGYIGTGDDGNDRNDFWEYIASCNAQTFYADADSDGYGNEVDTLFVTNCIVPAGYVVDSTDCDDTKSIVHPDAAEILNGIDDNCNGIIDYDQDIWVQKTSFGGTPRSGAVGFSIGNKGYLGTGSGTADFWEYDFATNTWTQKANYGGEERYDAVGFSIGSKGYIGTGGNWSYGNYKFNADFWEYNPANNTWTKRADFGGAKRDGAVGFSIGSKGYIGTGSNDNGYKKDFWEYDPSGNTWTQKADFGGSKRNGAVGFSIGNKGYIGTGHDGTYKNDFWEYDPSSNDWTQKADFAGTARSSATGFSIGSKGYIGTGDMGNPNFTKDFWEYDPAGNTWTEKAVFGGSARNSAAGFSIGSKGYIGTGSPGVSDFWEYTPVCSGFTFYADADGDGFGSASDTYNASDCVAPGGYGIDSFDCNDNDGMSYPGACDGTNGIDDNCDGIVDNGFGTTTFYLDADNDGYGDPLSYVNECNQPAGYLTDNTDCQDANALIHPGVMEILNGIDDNCTGIIDDTGIWTQKANFGGTTRSEAIGFSIGNKGYIGTGVTCAGCSGESDFWEYDPSTNAWTQKADFGGTPRYRAVGFSIGTKGYIGTGFDYSLKNDFWEYDPSTNVWIQKSNFGGTARYGAVGFSIGTKGYIGTGFDGGYRSDFWEYDPSTDTWAQRADFGGTGRYDATGFSIGDKGYIGTGFDDDFWEYNPATNTWTQKASLVYTYAAVGFSIGSKGYIGTGVWSKNDFWEYDPSTDTWARRANFGGAGRYDASGFSIGNKGYIGAGGYSDFWEYRDCDSAAVVYADADGDSFGDANNYFLVSDCIIPSGYVVDSTDCDDNNFDVNPSAIEICDGIDNNCDGTTDPLFTFYADTDGDNYGTSTNSVQACSPPNGYVIDSADCNDADASINPSAAEICNNIDDNCLNGIDDGLIFITYYADADADNFGDASSFVSTCDSAPAGYVADNTDCNDADAVINPSATEVCNNLDDNCLNGIDDGLIFVTYYLDGDGDNFGDASSSVSTCNGAPSGYIIDNTDCNDASATINPSATEVCNNLDDNCNGSIDDGLTFVTLYADADSDNYGDANNSIEACAPVSGYLTDNTDCDDDNASVNPSATEICNNIDDDCNGTTDDGLTLVTYYADADGDNYGDTNNSIDSCAPVSGYLTDNTDCDDSNANVNPDATEILFNGIDDDCDGYIDEFGTGNNSFANTKSVFSLFPNPTNGEFVAYLQLNSDVNNEAIIEVINLLWQVVLNRKTSIVKGKLQQEIQLKNAASGIYRVRVIVEENVYSAQIIYQH